jgi:hypothetical protein
MDSERSSTNGGAYSKGSESSSSDSFETPDAVKEAISLFEQATVAAYVKRTLAVFAMIGLGLGITGYFIISSMLREGGLVDVTIGYLLAMIVLLFVAFLGVTLAAVITTDVRIPFDRSLIETCLVCGVSCYAGVLIMTVLSITLIRRAFPPIVAAEFSTIGLFALSVLTSVPAALIATGVVWIDHRYMESVSRSSG